MLLERFLFVVAVLSMSLERLPVPFFLRRFRLGQMPVLMFVFLLVELYLLFQVLVHIRQAPFPILFLYNIHVSFFAFLEILLRLQSWLFAIAQALRPLIAYKIGLVI